MTFEAVADKDCVRRRLALVAGERPGDRVAELRELLEDMAVLAVPMAVGETV
jgi:hypothetical protein